MTGFLLSGPRRSLWSLANQVCLSCSPLRSRNRQLCRFPAFGTGFERSRLHPRFPHSEGRSRRTIMPRGDKSKYTEKQKRQAAKIEEGYKDRGVSEDVAEARAWATVNKMSGGGKKPGGSGRGKKVYLAPAKKGGRLGGRAAAHRSAAERSESARKAARTRARRKAARLGSAKHSSHAHSTK